MEHHLVNNIKGVLRFDSNVVDLIDVVFLVGIGTSYLILAVGIKYSFHIVERNRAGIVAQSHPEREWHEVPHT
ncbi:hypothetical protein [Iningainema tapete]|uniref:Uncharacterized protein n=1 Tax=Iningainema tapete BLCC-T55 TaxID=2748662 RepID=A0A8J6XIX0_9CYAN|nr:hypothetical protein [Iningainema tapete]MBD2771082.1 hypothetical protein [Iningainema tapete BLCC-T55]